MGRHSQGGDAAPTDRVSTRNIAELSHRLINRRTRSGAELSRRARPAGWNRRAARSAASGRDPVTPDRGRFESPRPGFVEFVMTELLSDAVPSADRYVGAHACGSPCPTGRTAPDRGRHRSRPAARWTPLSGRARPRRGSPVRRSLPSRRHVKCGSAEFARCAMSRQVRHAVARRTSSPVIASVRRTGRIAVLTAIVRCHLGDVPGRHTHSPTQWHPARSFIDPNVCGTPDVPCRRSPCGYEAVADTFADFPECPPALAVSAGYQPVPAGGGPSTRPALALE